MKKMQEGAYKIQTNEKRKANPKPKIKQDKIKKRQRNIAAP
jgi:hypothetical protein